MTHSDKRFTLGLAMTLRPGAYEKYKLAHDQLWPELAEGMRANAVNMVIYRDGARLFLFASAPSEARWERSRQDPILAKWDKLMTQLLETDDRGGIAFTVLSKAFGFGEFV
jgi:L-rhamnose mutarotase